MVEQVLAAETKASRGQVQSRVDKVVCTPLPSFPPERMCAASTEADKHYQRIVRTDLQYHSVVVHHILDGIC